MEDRLKKTLRAISLETRHILEGQNDEAGDLEQQLNRLGIWRNRSKPIEEMPHLSTEDREARRVVEAYLDFRQDADVAREDAVGEFIRESAYTWANRLFALRIMEARGIIDEVILKKEVYAGRSLVHNRYAKKNPDACRGEDDGLFAVLFNEFLERSKDIPDLFNPEAPATKLRPSVAALKRIIALLSGLEKPRGQEPANDEVFEATDAFGRMYQYWNSEEKDKVFKKLGTVKGFKIQGSDIIHATQLYTEPYMVKFLVQNSLGSTWMSMHPESKLFECWEYYVKDADRDILEKRPISEITFMDPACGSGRFHLEAFDQFYDMYIEEGKITDPKEICASILNKNLFGIDIDDRAVQIAKAALWLKAVEKAPDMQGNLLRDFHAHIISTNIKMPKEKDHLKTFLRKHPDDEPLKPALEVVFSELENVAEFGSLIQIEEPVERVLQGLKASLLLFGNNAGWNVWKRSIIMRLKEHLETEIIHPSNLAQFFFSHSVDKSLDFFDLLSKKYYIVAANPPYISFRNAGQKLASFLRKTYPFSPTDTYSAMVWKGMDLLEENGRLAFVTQDGLMLLPSLSNLRARILKFAQLEVVAHLGPRAFEDISGEKVSVITMVLQSKPPKNPPIWIRLVGISDKPIALGKSAMQCEYRLNNGLIQAEYLRTKNKQWLYFAPKRFVDILAKEQTLSTIALVKQGIITGNNDRYVRMWWEVGTGPVSRWRPYFFGSEDIIFGANGYPLHVIDWRNGESWRFIRPRSHDLWFRNGVTFGRLGKEFRIARLLPIALFDVNASAAVFLSGEFEPWIFAYLSSPLIISILKALNVSLTFLIQDIASIPLPDDISEQCQDELAFEASRLLDIRTNYAKLQLFSPIWDSESAISSANQKQIDDLELILSNHIDLILQRILGFTDLEADGIRELAVIIDEDSYDDNMQDHSSQSTYASTSVDMCENNFSYLALRLLGHRWPKQIEANEPLPDWADKDGIIPLTEGCGERTLLERVRERIPAEFPGGRVQDIEHEFEEIMGTSLEKWLAGPFFKHHISQFKKRPIAWQIESKPPNGGGRSRKARQGPVFSCLVYYHKLDGDLLHKIRTQYVWNLRDRFETEMRTLENIASPSNDQLNRLGNIRRWIEELKDFDARLEEVSLNGFDCTKLKEIVDQEPLDKWTSRDCQDAPPTTKEEFFLQEKRYDPDINDGVRVNVAPLQIAGLLSADVLAKKDLEKAIQDRSEWRADERRWCRKGKLLRPGWWKEDGQ